MIDELLGRLEAATCKFDIGRGGISQLTPQDIAAALGMCEDKFAATIYQVAAGGTIVDWEGLDRALAQVQFGEWRNRADRMINAQLAQAAVAIASKSARPDLHERARMLMSGAKAAMWPALVEETYTAMRRALIAELRSTRTCQTCQGRGSVVIGQKLHECQDCLSTGIIAVSDRTRAHMIGVAHSTYRQSWKPVYEWMYRTLLDAVARGREQFSRAMERVAA